MNAFINTNVTIGYIFSLDPFNRKSNIVFDNYDSIFWSNHVFKEYKKITTSKQKKLINLFNNFTKYIHNFESEIDKNVCLKFINSIHFNKEKKNHEIVLSIFWKIYVDNFVTTKQILLNAIKSCLIDLNVGIFSKSKELIESLFCVNERTINYDDLKKILSFRNIHKEDIEIILDAHDFNLNHNIDLDFITFDTDFYKGVTGIKNEFSFNRILKSI